MSIHACSYNESRPTNGVEPTPNPLLMREFLQPNPTRIINLPHCRLIPARPTQPTPVTPHDSGGGRGSPSWAASILRCRPPWPRHHPCASTALPGGGRRSASRRRRPWLSCKFVWSRGSPTRKESETSDDSKTLKANDTLNCAVTIRCLCGPKKWSSTQVSLFDQVRSACCWCICVYVLLLVQLILHAKEEYLLYPCLCLSDLRNNALQLGDSRFVPLERVRYTRDQLLEMREVLIRSYSVYLAVYFITWNSESNSWRLLGNHTSNS